MTTEPANDNPEIIPQTSEKTVESGSQMRRDLIVWLALLPVIMGLLVLCGQVALLFSLGQSPANTASRLRANYSSWIYDLIPPINIPQLIEDIQEDLRAEGVEEEPLPVVTGAFWIPPTSTPGPDNLTATVTPPVAIFSPTPEPPEDEPTPNNPATNTRVPSATASTIPSATVTASPTHTNTWAPLFTPTNEPPPPTRTPTVTRTPTPLPTNTPRPRPTNTAVPTKTNTATLKPTATATLNPTPTNTQGTPPPTATSAPVTIVPPPDPRLVSPIADSSEPNPNGEGCIAYFGYENSNATAIDIPVGSLNQLNIDIQTSPPTSFGVGTFHGELIVEWNTGSSVTWRLGGGSATAEWCNP